MSEFYKFKLLELMKRNAPLAEIKALGLGEKFKLDELLIFLKNKLFKDHGTKSAHRDLVYLKMTLQDISITDLEVDTCQELKEIGTLADINEEDAELFSFCVTFFENVPDREENVSEPKEDKILLLEAKLTELQNQLAILQAKKEALKKHNKQITDENRLLQKRLEKNNTKLSAMHEKLKKISEKKERSVACSKPKTAKIVLNPSFKEFYDRRLFKKIWSSEDLIAEAEKQGLYLSNNKISEQLASLAHKHKGTSLAFQDFKAKDNYRLFSENYFKVLLISDLHLLIPDDEAKAKIAALYEYALQNNIFCIINLGDTIGYHNHMDFTLTEDDAYQIADEISRLFPTNTGIPHLLLGGNHDATLLEYDVDPLAVFMKNNQEFYSLGYDHAMLTFNGIEKILLIHPNQRFNNKNALFSPGKLTQYLDNFYRSQKLGDELAFTFLGHLHLSHINAFQSFTVVPSYLKDRLQNGALEATISFNAAGQITELAFTSLISKDKLEKASEIILERKK